MIGGDRLQASRRKTDHHNPALERDAFGRPVEDVPPDRVIDDVGALAAGGRPYLGNEILMAVVDRQVGSHFTADGEAPGCVPGYFSFRQLGLLLSSQWRPQCQRTPSVLEGSAV